MNVRPRRALYTTEHGKKLKQIIPCKLCVDEITLSRKAGHLAAGQCGAVITATYLPTKHPKIRAKG